MYQRALLFVCLFGIAFGATCDTANVICQLSSGSNCANSDSNTFNVGGNSYSFSLFNAISFGNFNLPQGDVQGRLAVQGDFTAGTTKGATIADQISTSNGDTDFTYSLIVGGNANWVSGELYPLGDSTLSKGSAFVGGSFTGADSLAARVTANCNGNSGCLDSYFNNAKSFWQNWSVNLSNKNSTVAYSISESKILTITCDSSDNRLNIVNIPDSDFNTVVGYSSSGCSSNSVFVFNIFGGNDVIFGGEGFVNQVGTVYNIVGSGRMVNATVFVRGSIINPSGSLDQVGGTIFGNVVVGEISNLVQINRPTCPSDVGTSSDSSTTASGSETSSASSTTDENTGSDDARGNSAAQSIVCVFALICLCFFAF